MSRTISDVLAEMSNAGGTSCLFAVLRLMLTTTLCLILTGCSAGTPGRSSTNILTSPSDGTNLPARADDTDGSFHLVFELPKTTWRTTEAIDGHATLSVVGTNGINVAGLGSGLLGFTFAEVGGDRQVSWAREGDCTTRRLAAADPIVLPITKTAGYSVDAPQTDFYRSFATDPLLHLPAGDWTITAVTWFSESQDCRSQTHQMSASVLVHVQG